MLHFLNKKEMESYQNGVSLIYKKFYIKDMIIPINKFNKIFPEIFIYITNVIFKQYMVCKKKYLKY